MYASQTKNVITQKRTISKRECRRYCTIALFHKEENNLPYTKMLSEMYLPDTFEWVNNRYRMSALFQFSFHSFYSWKSIWSIASIKTDIRSCGTFIEFGSSRCKVPHGRRTNFLKKKARQLAKIRKIKKKKKNSNKIQEKIVNWNFASTLKDQV